MYGALDISVSGMIAQRTRAAVIANNLANADTVMNDRGEYDPYLRREIMFAAGDPQAADPSQRALGVHVQDIEPNPDALRPMYDPSSPFADAGGYVQIPDIDPLTEQVNMLAATRAYEANAAAAEATKTILAQSLRLLA